MWKRDWKVSCPDCDERFPKNDFAAFYRTSLDEKGFFRRDRGRPLAALPCGALGPERPGAGGLGRTNVMADRHRQGNVHHAIADLASAYWQHLIGRRGKPGLGLRPDLREAPLRDKAAVLSQLHIADVYPEMDYYPLGRLGFQHLPRRLVAGSYYRLHLRMLHRRSAGTRPST